MVTLEKDAFFSQLVEQDEISWKAMILDSVKAGEMDPWDIDISHISSKFLEMLTKLKELNFQVSGKVILTSALLLKLKSKRFVDEDITALDQLIASTEIQDEEFFDSEYSDENYENDRSVTVGYGDEQVTLQKRTPLARKRKVSVYDLIEALEHALQTKKKRTIRERVNAPPVIIPKKSFDISMSMDHVYENIKGQFEAKKDISFSQLIPSESKNDKIYTFIPLLHLRNARKLDLHQDEHFTDFSITPVDAQEELKAELSED